MAFETEEQLKRLDSKLKRELGPVIVTALENPETLEICVNSDGRIWVEEKNKQLYDTGKCIAPENLLAALGTIAARSGVELNESRSILESRMPLDGSRVEGTIPPTTPEGPSMTVRKHASAIFPLFRYVDEGRIPAEGADFLRQAIRDMRNILVAGGTSSGKTTFTNAIIREILNIAPEDRLLIIEDEIELQCATTNKERFVTSEHVSMRTLVKTTMRCRPDRIIIGEVRDGAALDLLKAWNTGHPGGVATIHSNDAHSALNRLEQLILEVTPGQMSSLIAEAVNIIVYMKEMGRIGRQVTEIIQINGFKGGEYQYEHIYELGGGYVRKH